MLHIELGELGDVDVWNVNRTFDKLMLSLGLGKLAEVNDWNRNKTFHDNMLCIDPSRRG